MLCYTSLISSIVRKLNESLQTPLALAVSFVATLLLFAVFAAAAPGVESGLPSQAGRGILGGPRAAERSRASGLPILIAQGAILQTRLFDAPVPESGGGENMLLAAAVRDKRIITGVAAPAASGVFTYNVKRGDTTKTIAARFGVSLASLVDANPRLKRGKIVPGDEVLVLSTGGAVYRTAAGESVEAVAARFNMEAADILRANRSIARDVLPEATIVIIPSFTGIAPHALPSLTGYFKKPTDAYSWGELHNHNAVDMTAVCGTPVFSVAEGIIVPDADFGDGTDGWNGGYGRFVMIEHPNSVKTRSAHLAKVLVSTGDYVKQGELIGAMGKTGDASGCHLHFEVYGAANPFAR